MSVAEATFRSGAGAKVILGPCLGQGGEGAVYAVRDHPKLAVKVYHQPPPADQQAKLRAMVNLRDQRLTALCAWPLDVLKDHEGAVVGLIMPRLEDLRPLHLLYSPKDRRREFPEANWSDLVRVAGALAEAFAGMHHQGHQIGDVNPNNVLVALDGGVRLKLIDADSFQIQQGDQRWPCRVGARECLPPELATGALGDQPRPIESDHFGLAILIFQLLFLGRHPYAGIPLSGGPPPSIPEAIRRHRFAYGPGARERGVARPPHTPDLSLLPDELAHMFEDAFGPDPRRRPSAPAWAEALGHLWRSGLRRCARDEAHAYPRGAWGCPWCTLQDQLGHALFTPHPTRAPFDPQAIRKQILDGAVLPERPVDPSLDEGAVAPGTSRPLIPLGIALAGGLALVGAGISEALRLSLGVGGGIALLAGIGGWLRWRQRQIRLRQALAEEGRAIQEALKSVLERWREAVTPWVSTRRGLLQALTRAGARGISPSAPEEASLTQGLEQARRQAMELHLSAFRIDQARLPALNQHRLKRLRHAGVETAADVRRITLEQVGNIGETLIERLIAWREAHEATLRFDEARVWSELIARDQAMARSREEGRLRDGPHRLAQLREEAEARLGPLQAQWDQLKCRERAIAGALAALSGRSGGGRGSA